LIGSTRSTLSFRWPGHRIVKALAVIAPIASMRVIVREKQIR
jgi:hypothetical protein